MIDLIGYTLEDAKKFLNEKGFYNIVVEKATSPRNKNLEIIDKEARVVKLVFDSDIVKILVCI